MLTVKRAGIETFTGTIKEVKPNEFVSFVFRKPRSQTDTFITFPWSQVVAVSGNIGEVGTIVCLTSSQIVLEGKGVIEDIDCTFATGEINGAKFFVNLINSDMELYIDKYSDKPKKTRLKANPKTKR